MSWKGKIVEYLSQGKLELGVVLEEKKDKLRILSLGKKEKTYPPQKILHTTSYSINSLDARDTLMQELREIQQNRDELAGQIQLEELWELLSEEGERSYRYDYLRDLYFSEKVSEDFQAALLRALYTDHLYFKRQPKELFVPHSPEVVEKILEKKQREEEREKEREWIGRWLKDVWQNQPSESSLSKELQHRVISEFKEVVLCKATPKIKGLVKGYLDLAGIPSSKGPFQMLVKMGIFSENENLQLLELDIPTSFTPEVEEGAEKMVRDFPQILERERKKRKTYPELRVFAIDEETTEDRDDALSLEITPEGYRLGIHIADVAGVIGPHSLLDQVAMNRGTSIYMPDATIDMFPSPLTKRVFSLDEATERLTLSLFVQVDKKGQVLSYQVQETSLVITHNYSYGAIEEKIDQGDEFFNTLHDLALKIYESRMAQGAQNIFFPFFNFHIEDGKVSLEKIVSLSKSQFLVSEYMILANHLLGAHVHKYGVPAVFRGQPTPENYTPMEKSTYLSLYGVRRFLKRTNVVTRPEHHFTLGLSEYLQATSPIRRYGDIVNQRQIKSILATESSYTEEEVREIIQKTEVSLEQARQISRFRREYWILKYIHDLHEPLLPAMVLNHFPNHRLLIQIHDSLPDPDQELPMPQVYECTVPYRGNDSVSPGTWIQVHLGRVDPHERVFEVSFDSILQVPPGE